MQEAMDRIARYFAAEYEDYDEDHVVLEAYAGRGRGSILELGCGTGRALLPLAQAGHVVTGVDISPKMLEIARERASLAGVQDRTRLICSDFADVALDGEFAFIFCVMNTFLHLPDTAAQVSALRHWRQHLTSSGILLVEVLHPDATQLASLDGKLEWQQTWTDAATGHTIMKYVTRTVDLAEQTIHVNPIYDDIDGEGRVRRTVAPFTLRYVWRFEAELLLDKAGFALEGLYGDWDMAPFASDSQRMILVARKRR
jgi:SAM-dependent methyltransferase